MNIHFTNCLKLGALKAESDCKAALSWKLSTGWLCVGLVMFHAEKNIFSKLNKHKNNEFYDNHKIC